MIKTRRWRDGETRGKAFRKKISASPSLRVAVSFPSSFRLHPFLTLTAHTLYSGIFEIGSCAEIVNWFTLFRPAQ